MFNIGVKVVLGALVCLLLWHLVRKGDSEELVVQRRLDSLVGVFQVDKDTGRLEKASRSKRAASFFAEPLELVWDENKTMELITTPSELSHQFLSFITQLESLQVTLQDLQIEVDAASGKAEVKLTANILGIILGEGQFFDRHLLRVGFAKLEDQWLIQRVEHLENLRK